MAFIGPLLPPPRGNPAGPRPMITNPRNPVPKLPNNSNVFAQAGRAVLQAGVDYAFNPENWGTMRDAAGNFYNQYKGKNMRKDSSFVGEATSDASGYYNTRGLSDAPNPLPVKLNSGIKPNTYTNTYMEAAEDSCAPLHVACARFQFPTSTSNVLYDYFMNVIAFDIQTKAQDNVSFNLDITTKFTAAEILSAMNDLCTALQTYYYYNSIISYFRLAGNNNGGMIYLRSSMSAENLDDLAILERKLLNIPVPPRLFEYIRYLMSNFLSGPNQGAPIIKIIPDYMHTNGASPRSGSLAESITALSTDTNIRIFTIMSRCLPAWRKSTLPDIPYQPLYDPQFLTIFANLPFTVESGGTAVEFPAVSTDDESWVYNSYTNDLDGVAYAMTSAYKSTEFTPSLMVPQYRTDSTSTKSYGTRFSYYEVSGTKKFYDATLYPFLTFNRGETYTWDSGDGLMSGHRFGCDLCQSVSAATVRQTCYNVTDYLVSLDLMSGAGPKSAKSREMMATGEVKPKRRPNRKPKQNKKGN